MNLLPSSMLRAFLDTPPLWRHTRFGVTQFELPRIDLQRVRPIGLPANRRLGHKIEYLFVECLQGQDRYELLHHSILIKNGVKTLGEIDFILKDREQPSLLQVELTYKFYLIDSTISDPIHQLIGPNRRDLFLQKITKIRDGQFNVPLSPPGRDRLRGLEIDSETLVQQACFKAQLFIPYHAVSMPVGPFNQHCIAGFWIRFRDFDTDAFKEFTYCLPTKDEWLLTPYDTGSWMAHNELLIEVYSSMRKQRAPMVWMKKHSIEFEKFFVVWW